jgi:hypothetical protein
MGMIRGKLPRDAWAALVVFAISAAAGMVYMSTFDGQAYFAQHMFGPGSRIRCCRARRC